MHSIFWISVSKNVSVHRISWMVVHECVGVHSIFRIPCSECVGVHSWLEREAVNLKVASSSLVGSVFAPSSSWSISHRPGFETVQKVLACTAFSGFRFQKVSACTAFRGWSFTNVLVCTALSGCSVPEVSACTAFCAHSSLAAS